MRTSRTPTEANTPDGSPARSKGHAWLVNLLATLGYYRFRLLRSLKREFAFGRFVARVKRVFVTRNRRLEALLAQRPFSLNIETTNICNARCRFCAYPKRTDKKTQEMTSDLYEKLIREYSEMGGGTLDFSPVNGDFFLDSQVIRRIETARRYPNIGTITVVTNGIALDKIKDSWAYFIANTDIMHFSVGGLTRESYRDMYGVDRYERVRSNLLDFARLRNELRPEYALGLLLRVANKSEVLKSRDFQEFQQLGFDIIIDNVYSNWGGTVLSDDLPPGAVFRKNLPLQAKRNPCFVFYLGLGITSSGQAIACSCMNEELSPALTVGDCSTQTLKEIWTGEKYAGLRASFGTESLPEICQRCTHYMDGVAYSLKPEVLAFKDGRYPFGY